MREVHSPRFRDYFTYNNKWNSFSDFYFYNQTVFNKFSLSVVFIVLNFILGIFNNACLVIAISCSLLLIYLYLKTKKECQSLIVRRKCPIYARENDILSIEYSLGNTSAFILENFQITDSFDGTKEVISNIEFSETIPAASIVVKKKNYTLNAGMGVKKFGPLVAYVSDPLNIFHFKVVEDKVETIKVYPYIGKIKDMMIRGDKYALHFGLYETQSRGDTTNFIGIRPYRDGDPINRINWKLSMKSDKKVINEFEKNVNATFTLILNMDERIHMGKGIESTWEYAKDISLAILAKQVSSSNTVQFFSNDTFVARGSGVEHMNFLEMVVCTLGLSKAQNGSDFIKKAVLDISHEAKVLYITPAFAGELLEDGLNVLKRYAKINPNIHVAFVDGTLEIADLIKGLRSPAFKGFSNQTQIQLKRSVKELNDCGIECSIITIDKKIMQNKAILNSLNTIRGESLGN